MSLYVFKELLIKGTMLGKKQLTVGEAIGRELAG